MRRNSIQWMLMVLLVGGFAVSFASAQEAPATQPAEKIPHPADNAFVSDVLNIIDPLNEWEINGMLSALQEETGVTMYVVLLPSLDQMGYENAAIEDVAAELMNKWNVSPKTLDGKPWDKGVLVLISRTDKAFKFRVETGQGWGTDLDKPVTDVLLREMYPYFEKGKYSLGLTKGIQSLEAAVRMQCPVKKIPPKIAAPKEDDFVLDTANLFPLEINFAFNDACRKLYKDFGVPVFIVTAPSLESVARKGLNFDTVAMRFFLHWPVGPETRRKAFQENGVLIFLSPDDNRIDAQIQGAAKDALVRKELQNQIVTQIILAVRNRNLPQGILESVQTVRQALEEGKLPKPAAPSSTAPESPTTTPQ